MSKKALRTGIAGLLLAALTVLAGCGSPIRLHPISPDDIFAMPEGCTVKTAFGEFATGKAGWFVSDDYMKEIMQCKVDK